MSATLYLIQTRARSDYICPACQRKIPRGSLHFRHDPYPLARVYRREPTTHWCRQCILASDPSPQDPETGRIRVPAVLVTHRASQEPVRELPPLEPIPAPHGTNRASRELVTQLPLWTPIQVEFIGIGHILSDQLAKDPSLIYSIKSGEFEEFICDRLFAMGFEPRRVGETNRKDGGVDVVFWPRLTGAFPFLGAAQVKHHHNPVIKEGSGTVRDFAGTIAGFPFNAGLLITNTLFTPDAEWFAREHAKLIRLRDFRDIRRWLFNNFDDEAEWREIPNSIELCPGIVIRIR
jgi:hypothetical protein